MASDRSPWAEEHHSPEAAWREAPHHTVATLLLRCHHREPGPEEGLESKEADVTERDLTDRKLLEEAHMTRWSQAGVMTAYKWWIPAPSDHGQPRLQYTGCWV